jgi:signal transduction histidine kinase
MKEKPLTVLLIEDNPGDVRLIRQMLSQARSPPVTLECVDRLEAGLARLAAGGVDVVLLDLSLPDSHGLDTFSKAYTCTPAVPIIVLTGLDDETTAITAVREGAQDYLVKGDVAGHLLVRAMQYAIERKRVRQKLRVQARQLEARVAERTRELQTIIQELEAASRFKSEFLTNISHELRTPLNSIIGFAELLTNQDYGPLNEKQTRYVKNIWQSGNHLLRLINDLLDLSKIEAGKLELQPESFHLPEALRAVLESVRPQAKTKTLHLSLKVDASPTLLVADPLRFKQILNNLLSNAVKFTPAGGTVTLSAKHASPTAKVEWRMADVREVVEIAVEDTGIGIQAEDLPKLFEKFTQLDISLAKRYQGAGLGLALTKKLVDLHGGRIWAASPGEGHGSTFTVALPLEGLGLA